jgi:single-strand DNA-binding protein
MRGLETVFQGKLSRDAEVRYSQDGKPRLSFSVAVDDADDTSKYPIWANCTIWGDQGEAEFQKGQLVAGVSVYVEGWVKARAYMSKDGEAKASTDVTVRTVQVIGLHGRSRDVMDKAPMAGQAGSNLLTDDSVPF